MPNPVFPGTRFPGSGVAESVIGNVDTTTTGKTVIGTVDGDRVSVLAVDDDGADADYTILLNDTDTDDTVTNADVEVAVEITSTGSGTDTFTVETVATTTG